MSYHKLPEAFKFGNKVNLDDYYNNKEDHMIKNVKSFVDFGPYQTHKYYCRDFIDQTFDPRPI